MPQSVDDATFAATAGASSAHPARRGSGLTRVGPISYPFSLSLSLSDTTPALVRQSNEMVYE